MRNICIILHVSVCGIVWLHLNKGIANPIASPRNMLVYDMNHLRTAARPLTVAISLD